MRYRRARSNPTIETNSTNPTNIRAARKGDISYSHIGTPTPILLSLLKNDCQDHPLGTIAKTTGTIAKTTHHWELLPRPPPTGSYCQDHPRKWVDTSFHPITINPQ